MFGQIIKIGKDIVLVGLVVGLLVVLGNTIAILLNWDWLTYFFVLIRNLLLMIDWVIPTDTLLTLVGISFTIQVALWAYKATWWLIRWFRNH